MWTKQDILEALQNEPDAEFIFNQLTSTINQEGGGGEMRDRFCVKTVFASNAFTSHQCHRSAKVIFEGRPYCGLHDPIKKKFKADIRMKIWKERFAIQNEASKRRGLMEQILGNKTTIELEEMAKAIQ